MTHSPTMSERADAEEYLDKADLRPARLDEQLGLGLDGPLDVTCLHCSNAAIASCLVEDSETVLQLVCADHTAGIILWRRSL
jgi:hypothetical protein